MYVLYKDKRSGRQFIVKGEAGVFGLISLGLLASFKLYVCFF